MAKKKQAFGSKRNIRVSAKLFAAANLFVSREETRYLLQGVHIEPHPDGGVLMVATNGTSLLAIRDQDGIADAGWICPVPPLVAQACVRHPKKIDARPGHIHFIGKNCYVTRNAFDTEKEDAKILGDSHIATTFAPPIDGIFPDWRILFTKPTDETNRKLDWCDINAAYLTNFSTAAKLIHQDSQAINLSFSDNSGPILVTITPEAVGLVMPLRGLGGLQTPPNWINGSKHVAETA